MQFGDTGERMQRIQNAAFQYAPKPETNVYLQQAQPQREARPVPPGGGTFPVPETSERPQPQRQAPAPRPQGTQTQIPQTQLPQPQTGTQLPQRQARGQVFEREPGDISSPYASPSDRIAKDTASRVLSGYDGSSTVGQSPYGAVYDRTSRPYRPATASTTPTRGPLGSQFPSEESPAIDPFKEFDTPEKREVPDIIKEFPAWRFGGVPDTAEGAEDAAKRGVSDAIRAAATDMPDALL
jgi:hypothetical protein